jgi:cytochrome c oxidase subunit IV
MADAEHHAAEAVEQHHGLEPRQYIVIGVVLTVITVVELIASLWDDGDALGDALIPVLLILSAVKFAAVVAFFMHLRFDSPLFTRIFVGSLGLGAAVLLALISLFWNDLTLP